METVSFKEVHESLENEVLFLNKEHNIDDFKNKADFLKTIGLNNSIATRIYEGVVDNKHLLAHYKIKYPNNKFIILPQLERVLEKYNLYQRDLECFMGDIPEKNIKDLQNFRVYFQDLRKIDKLLLERIVQDCKNQINSEDYKKLYSFVFYSVPINLSDCILNLKAANRFIRKNNSYFNSPLQIASVESLFNEKAWEHGKARILNRDEIQAKSQVDLDPIITFEFENAFAIVTAWGDEANDELIFNQQLN